MNKTAQYVLILYSLSIFRLSTALEVLMMFFAQRVQDERVRLGGVRLQSDGVRRGV